MLKRLFIVLIAGLFGLTTAPERVVKLDGLHDRAEARGGFRGGARARAGGFHGRAHRAPSGARMHHRPRPSARPRPARPNPGFRPNRQAGLRPADPSFRPARPSTRPATRPRPDGDRPGFRPPSDKPGHRPPGLKPGQRPPGGGASTLPARPRPPVERPPGWRPPGWRPPGGRPPSWRPPPYPPPYYRPPNHYWGPYYWYPTWGWYFTAVVAGSTLVFIDSLPEDDGCEPVEYEGEQLYLCDGVLYRAVYYEDRQVYEIVNEAEDAPPPEDAASEAQATPSEDTRVGEDGFRWTD